MKTTISQNILQWIFLISGLLILSVSSGKHKMAWSAIKQSRLIIIIIIITICVSVFGTHLFYSGLHETIEILKVNEHKMKRSLEIVQNASQNVSKSLYIASAVGKYDEFETTSSRITFIFKVFNGSVFPISLVDDIKWHIKYLSMTMNRMPELVSKFRNIQRGEIGEIRIFTIIESPF